MLLFPREIHMDGINGCIADGFLGARGLACPSMLHDIILLYMVMARYILVFSEGRGGGERDRRVLGVCVFVSSRDLARLRGCKFLT